MLVLGAAQPVLTRQVKRKDMEVETKSMEAKGRKKNHGGQEKSMKVQKNMNLKKQKARGSGKGKKKHECEGKKCGGDNGLQVKVNADRDADPYTVWFQGEVYLEASEDL